MLQTRQHLLKKEKNKPTKQKTNKHHPPPADKLKKYPNKTPVSSFTWMFHLSKLLLQGLVMVFVGFFVIIFAYFYTSYKLLLKSSGTLPGLQLSDWLLWQGITHGILLIMSSWLLVDLCLSLKISLHYWEYNPKGGDVLLFVRDSVLLASYLPLVVTKQWFTNSWVAISHDRLPNVSILAIPGL